MSKRILVSAVLFAGMPLLFLALAWGVSTTDQNNKINQAEVQIKENTLKHEDLTANEHVQWNTYIDDTWGFSFEYPANWSVKTILENTNQPEYVIKRALAIEGSSGPSIVLYLWTNSDEPGIMEWFSQNATHLNSQEAQVPQYPNAIVGGKEAIIFHNPQIQSADQLVAIFNKGNLYFRLEYRNTDEEQSKETFQHILDTFR